MFSDFDSVIANGIANSALPSTGHHLYLSAKNGLVSILLNGVYLGIVKAGTDINGSDGTWITNGAIKRDRLESLVLRGIQRITRQPSLKVLY